MFQSERQTTQTVRRGTLTFSLLYSTSTTSNATRRCFTTVKSEGGDGVGGGGGGGGDKRFDTH
jgi:hypothetical protein